MQETFLRLTKEARGGRAPLQVRGWLFRVATNLVIGRGAPQDDGAPPGSAAIGRQEHEGMVAPSPEAGVLSREQAMEMERVSRGTQP